MMPKHPTDTKQVSNYPRFWCECEVQFESTNSGMAKFVNIVDSKNGDYLYLYLYFHTNESWSKTTLNYWMLVE